VKKRGSWGGSGPNELITWGGSKRKQSRMGAEACRGSKKEKRKKSWDLVEGSGADTRQGRTRQKGERDEKIAPVLQSPRSAVVT